jgi:hypothetical protein
MICNLTYLIQVTKTAIADIWGCIVQQSCRSMALSDQARTMRFLHLFNVKLPP